MPPGGASNTSFNNLLKYLKKESNENGSHLISHLTVKHRTDRCGFSLTESNKNSINLLVSLLVNQDVAVRKEAAGLLQLCLSSEDLTQLPSKQIFDEEACEKLEKEIFPALTKILQETKDQGYMDYWDVLVKLLGVHLHTRTKLLNTAMLVVQSAFKMTDPRIVERALRSWVVLMENFALVPEIINAPKRVKLLVMALKYRSPVQDESTYRLRIECWMELMHLLGNNLTFHGKDLVKEFIIFCFGHKTSGSEIKDSIASPSRPGFTPTKMMSPAKKFASLERVCLDALVQLFATRPLSTSLPKSSFKHPLVVTDTPVLANEFRDMCPLVFEALQNMTENVRYTNRSEVLKLSAVWDGIGGHMTSIAGMSNPTEPICCFLRTISSIAKHLRRQEKLHSLLFNLLEIILKLPESILNRRIFSHTAFEPKVSPLVFVYDILMQEVILNSKEETKGLHVVFEKASVLVKHHDYLIDIIQKMEMVAPDLTFIGLENLGTCWHTVCKSVVTWEGLLEVKGVTKSFSTIQHFLRFPLQYLPDREPKFWREWGSLYANMNDRGELTVGIESAKVCEEMTEKLSQIYKGLGGSKKASSLLPQARCLQIILSQVIFSAIAREIKTQQHQEPLSGFKAQLAPIGHATRAVQYLNELSAESLEARDTELSEIILDSYTNLINSVEMTVLLKPVLKLIAPSLCALLKEDTLSSLTSDGLAPVAMKLYEAVTTAIEIRFSNSKDHHILETLEGFFIQCFQSKRSAIKNKISEVWAVTFSNIASQHIPGKLKAVLKQCASPGLKTQVSSDSQSGELNTFPSSSEFLDNVRITEPGIEAALKIPNKPGTPVKNTRAASRNSPFKTNFELKESLGSPSPERVSPRKAIKSPAMKPPQPRSVRLEDEDSCQFVKIQPKTKNKRRLTDHQKDKMTSRRDDIPALYSELSRDDSIINIPSQFMSQHSFDESSSSNSNFPTLRRSDVHINAQDNLTKANEDLTKQKEVDKADTKVGDSKTGKSAEEKKSTSAAKRAASFSSAKKDSDNAPAVKKDPVALTNAKKNAAKKSSDIAQAAKKDSVTSSAAIQESGVANGRDGVADEIQGTILERVDAITTSSGKEKIEDVTTTSSSQEKVEDGTTSSSQEKVEDVTTSTSQEKVEDGTTSLSQEKVEDGTTSTSQEKVEDGTTSLSQEKVEDVTTSLSQEKVEDGTTSSSQEKVEDVTTSTSQEKVEDVTTSPSQEKVEDGTTSPSQEKVEDGTTSPSQSLLQPSAHDNDSVDSNITRKGRPRKSIPTKYTTPQSTKRKRSVEDDAKKSSSKKTRRQIAKEIFGESGKSQSQDNTNDDKKDGEAITKNNSTSENAHIENSVEILSPPPQTTNTTETIVISSEDIITTQVIDDDSKVIVESVAIIEEVEMVKEDTNNDDSQDSQEEDIIENSQKPSDEDVNEKRRSRRSLKKQKSPGKKGTPVKDGSKVRDSSSGVDSKKNKFGETQLFAAAKKGDLEKVKQLIDQGANPNIPDAAGWSALHEVAISNKPNSTKIMKLLINAGGDVNCNNDGVTPLQESVGGGCVQHTAILLELGGKPGCDYELEELVKAANQNKQILQLLAKYLDLSKVKVSKEGPEVNVIQETLEMDIDSIQPLLAPSFDYKEVATDTTSDNNHKESSTKKSAASEDSKISDDNLKDWNNLVAAQDTSEQTQTVDKDQTEDDNLKESNDNDTKEDPKTADTKEVLNVDDLNSSLASSTADSDISGITELDNKQTEASVEDNIDQDKTNDDPKEDHEALKDEEPEVKFTEIEVRSREINIDVADTTLDDNHKEADLDTNVINDEDVSEPKVSPDSNKENKSESKQNIIEMPRPALKERKKVVIQSRVSRIINLSSAKSDSGSPDTSPSILSPSSGRPWSKYKPSPSHASPSAGILKRKRGDDTPSSTEGSPLTGKIRHVHFKPDPVSERVEIPRSIERTATRKKLRLYNPDQDILSKESTTGMRTFEETPPLDVSTGPIYPALITCNIPVKDLVLQLAASVTSIKILERDFATFCLSTVGDLATLNAAQVRNLRGVKLPKELTVKRVLSSLAKTSLVKKSPVLEITSKEEEEKIKAALFHGPSPSPTSPPKNTFSANFNTSPEKPAKLIQFSSNFGKIGRTTDLWQEELDSEEPLSVRAKKAAAAALLSNKEADEIAAPSSNKEAAQLNSKEAAQLNSKEAALKCNKDGNDTVEDDDKNIESNTKEATKAVSEPMESKGVNENQDKAPFDGIKPSEKLKVAEIKKVTAATSVDLNNLDAIMTKAELEGMQSYSKADLMVILQKTVQKQQRLAEFMTSVTTALNKPEQS